MNKCILVGTVNYPPRFNDTNYGAVLNVIVKTTHRYKNNAGEIIERNQQTRAALWGKLAELHRGVQQHDLVSLEGRLQNKKVQSKSGEETWQTEVVCNAFEVLRPANENSAPDAPEYKPNIPEDVEQEFGDDDIPF